MFRCPAQRFLCVDKLARTSAALGSRLEANTIVDFNNAYANALLLSRAVSRIRVRLKSKISYRLANAPQAGRHRQIAALLWSYLYASDPYQSGRPHNQLRSNSVLLLTKSACFLW